VTDINSHLTQPGQTHRCLANGPIIVGYDYHRNNGTITFTETDTKKTYCVAYTLNQLSEKRTQVTSAMFMPKNPVKGLMFNLLMKKKFQKSFEGAWNNLKQYCEGLFERGEQHSYSILFPEEEVQVMA